MSSLFGRMFFGAWLTAVIMVLAAVYITHIPEFGDPAQEDRWEGPELFREITHNLRMTRRHGIEHFGHWLERQPKDAQKRIFAIDRDGREILDRPIPQSMAPLFAALSYRNREARGLVDKKPSVAVKFCSPCRNVDVIRNSFHDCRPTMTATVISPGETAGNMT